jgi:hypothetical protein
MSEPHVIAALKRKRGELSGDMRDLERRMKACRAALAHVDETIRIFSPGFDVKAIKPRKRVHRSRYFDRGELSRIINDYLRTHSGPIAARAITATAMEAKGMEIDNPDLRDGIQKLVVNILRAMAKRGALNRSGVGQSTLWHLSE